MNIIQDKCLPLETPFIYKGVLEFILINRIKCKINVNKYIN